MYKKTTTLKKIRGLRSRYKIIQGGTSAGKTIAILIILIDKAAKTEGLRISVVSENLPHLKRGAINDFLRIMNKTGRYRDAGWNKSESTYTFVNGSYIEFFGAENESKLRGARRDILYINEANRLKFEAFQELSIRTELEVYLDYNPVEEFWVQTEVIPLYEGVEFVKVTYRDNEAIPTNTKEELKQKESLASINEYWNNWVSVYIEGELGVGNTELIIYNNWTTIDSKMFLSKESRSKNGIRFICFGLDFGFTNDPTALIALFRYDNKFVVHQLVCDTGLLNGDIATLIKKYQSELELNRLIVVADSSEPKSIAELSNRGIAITGVKKGAGSVGYGIGLIKQEIEFLITNTSTEILREVKLYQWQEDKGGKITNTPVDKNNHLLDAFRYSVMQYGVNNKNKGKVTVIGK